MLLVISAVEVIAVEAKKKTVNIGKNPIWTGFELMAREFVCVFFLQLGSLVRWTKGHEMKWWWHCMPFFGASIFLSQSICLLAHWFFFSHRFWFHLCVHVQYWNSFLTRLYLPIISFPHYIGYCSRGPLPSVYGANIFIKPLECSINFCVNNDNGCVWICGDSLWNCVQFSVLALIDKRFVAGDSFSLMRNEWLWWWLLGSLSLSWSQ